MDRFDRSELATIEACWAAKSEAQHWSGWAYVGDAPKQVWLYRARANWRAFPLVKKASDYVLLDEADNMVATSRSLIAALGHLEDVPGLDPAAPESLT